MQSIEYTKENHPILNQMYDILAELQKHNKKITICKVPAHIRIKGNQEVDKATKEAMDMPVVTTKRLLNTDNTILDHQEGREFRMTKGVGK